MVFSAIRNVINTTSRATTGQNALPSTWGTTTQQKANAIDFGDWSGGGDGGGADHFYEISPYQQAQIDIANRGQKLDEDKFAYDKTDSDRRFNLDQTIAQANIALNQRSQLLDEAKFNFDKETTAAQLALAAGDLQLAREKEANANYWKGQEIANQQALAKLDSSTRILTTQIDANARLGVAQISATADIAVANINAEVNRLDSYNRLRVGMAGAANDAERNRIMADWNKEQAQIAKMEDDTKRSIAEREWNVKGYEAQTQRANVLGNLALEQNKWILEKAQSPRDLFGLYMMQRGVTPDWEAIQSGNPTTGSAITVQNPLDVMKFDLGLQQGPIGPGASYGNVGQATAGGSQGMAGNPYLGDIGPAPGGSGGGGGAAGGQQAMADFSKIAQQYGPGSVSPQQAWSGIDFPTPTGPPAFDDKGVYDAAINKSLNVDTSKYVPPETPKEPEKYLPDRSTYTGVLDAEVANLKSGEYQKVRTGGAGKTNAKDFQKDLAVYITDAEGKLQDVTGQDFDLNPDQEITLRRMAGGTDMVQGYTTAPQFMAGDAFAGNPYAGGAKPEVIQNPWRAPIRVKNAWQTAADFGADFANKFAQRNPPPGGPRGRGWGRGGPAGMGWMGPQGQPPAMMPPDPYQVQAQPQMGWKEPFFLKEPFARPEPYRVQPGGGFPTFENAPWLNETFNKYSQNLLGNVDMNNPLVKQAMDVMGIQAPQAPGWEPWGKGMPEGTTGPAVMVPTGPQGGSYPGMPTGDISYAAPLPPETGGMNWRGGSPILDEGQPHTGQTNWMQKGNNQYAPDYQRYNPDMGMQDQRWRGPVTPITPEMQYQNDQQAILDKQLQEQRSNSGYYGPGPMAPQNDMMRYPTGTDVSQQYANAGAGDLYLQSSKNQYLNQYNNLPNWIKQLADYGAPIAPALANAVTGRAMSPANVASAFQQRGGGSLPSYQQFNQMDPGEQQLFQGYAQGPVGVPWGSVENAMAAPTQYWGQAQRSRGGIM